MGWLLAKRRKFKLRHCSSRGTREQAHDMLEWGMFDAAPQEDELGGDGGGSYNQGVIAYERHDIDEAIRLFTRAVGEMLSGADRRRAWVARNNLGIAMVQRGDAEEGLTQLRLAERESEGYPLVRRNLGAALRVKGELKESAVLLRLACTAEPEHASWWFGLAMTELERGEKEQAVEAMGEAVKAEPESPAAWDNYGTMLMQVGRPEEAIEAHAKAIELSPLRAIPHYNLARAYSRVGRDEESETAYRRHMELDPDHSCPLYELGCVLSRLKRSEEALELMRQYAELEPEDPRAPLGIGIELILLGRHDEAEEPLQLAADMDPEDSWTVMTHGRLKVEQGKPDDGIELMERALALDPSNRTAVQLLAQELVKRGDDDRAIAVLQADIERAGDGWIAWRVDATMKAMPCEGSAEESRLRRRRIHVLRSIKPRLTDSAWCSGILGELYLAADEFENAAASFGEVIAHDAASARAHLCKGIALNRLKRCAEALESLDRGLAIEPDSTGAIEHRVYALATLGRWDEAIRAARELLVLAPENAYAKSFLAKRKGAD